MRKLTFSGCCQWDDFLHLYSSSLSGICFRPVLLFGVQLISSMNTVFTLCTHHFSVIFSDLFPRRQWCELLFCILGRVGGRAGLLRLSIPSIPFSFFCLDRSPQLTASCYRLHSIVKPLSLCLLLFPMAVVSVSLLEFPMFLLDSGEFIIVH